MTGHLVTKEKTDTAKEGRPSASARTVAIGKAPTSADLDISRHTVVRLAPFGHGDAPRVQRPVDDDSTRHVEIAEGC